MTGVRAMLGEKPVPINKRSRTLYKTFVDAEQWLNRDDMFLVPTGAYMPRAVVCILCMFNVQCIIIIIIILAPS